MPVPRCRGSIRVEGWRAHDEFQPSGAPLPSAAGALPEGVSPRARAGDPLRAHGRRTREPEAPPTGGVRRSAQKRDLHEAAPDAGAGLMGVQACPSHAARARSHRCLARLAHHRPLRLRPRRLVGSAAGTGSDTPALYRPSPDPPSRPRTWPRATRTALTTPASGDAPHASAVAPALKVLSRF